jgi:hypothetical protein
MLGMRNFRTTAAYGGPSGGVRTAGAVIAGLGLICSAGCGGSDPTTALAGSTTSAPEAVASAGVVTAGVCIDGTGSVDPLAVTSMVDTVASAVTTWMPQPVDPVAEQAPVPGLSMPVRKVMAESSLGLAGEITFVDLVPVPGVVAEPALDAGYVDAAEARDRQAADAATIRQDNQAKADQAAGLLRATDWSAGSSEIYGCVEQLGRTTHAPTRNFVVLTDLAQTDVPQTGTADLSGARILVVHVGDQVAEIAAQQGTALAQWRSQNAADVQFVGPEEISRVVPVWLRTGGLP